MILAIATFAVGMACKGPSLAQVQVYRVVLRNASAGTVLLPPRNRTPPQRCPPAHNLPATRL